MRKHSIFAFLFCFTFLGCNSQKSENIKVEETTKYISENIENENKSIANKNITQFDSKTKTIHIFVALCDNRFQGIVPVPEMIGNGQDPDNNLYWGCAFGVRTYFRKSNEWKLLKTQKVDSVRLERLIFKHTTKSYYLVADAYDGQHIKQCTKDFLNSSAGLLNDTLHINDAIIGIAGNSKLVAYIGHDGLMDFQLSENYQNTDNKKRDVIILACYSKRYFSPLLNSANINPILWTSGLMAPEAYTIHDAITGYLNNETNEQIRSRAAMAYSKYQKCSVKAAKNLLVTGW